MSKTRVAFIDYWSLALNFQRGDVVNTINSSNGLVEPIPGLVTAVHPGIGFVDVEYPWGNQRVSPEYLIRKNPQNIYDLPSMVDTSYRGWDMDQSHVEDGTEQGYSYAHPRAEGSVVERLAADLDDRHRKLQVAAAQCLHNGLTEIQAYVAITSASKGQAPDHEIRDSLVAVYKPRQKNSIYWNAPGRRYRMNAGELEDGLPNCPKCGNNLQKTHYAKHTKLFVCPSCLFCIRPEDIDGLPPVIEETGFGVEASTDIRTAALKSAAWDKVKNQAIKYCLREYPQWKQYAEDVGGDVAQNHVDEMNIHEDVLPTNALAKDVDNFLRMYVWDDIKAQIKDAVNKIRGQLVYPDDAYDAMVEYVQEAGDELEFDKKELQRLLELEIEYDKVRVERWRAGSIRTILASNSPKLLDVRDVIGSDGLQIIHDLVRTGSRSDDLVTQFSSDFKEYGLGDAMFLLGASTADGLFDRAAYNTLVDILDDVRLKAKEGV